MTPHEAALVLSHLTGAWPWADWPDEHVELWLAALAPYEQPDALAAAHLAAATLDRPPTIAWMHATTRAQRDRNTRGLPELEAPPLTRERAAERLDEVRRALHEARRQD